MHPMKQHSSESPSNPKEAPRCGPNSPRGIPQRFEDFYAEAVRAMSGRDPYLDRMMKVPAIANAVNQAPAGE